MDYIKALMERIERLLRGEWSVPKFRAEYYDFYLEQVPDESLTDKDAEFFGYVQEKLDWTHENPPPQDRSDGWMNHDEYIEWVREHRQLYSQGLPVM